MCGIAGYVGQGSREILERMTNTIRHRGPDDEGVFVQGNVGLGHRRLSIIDLSPLGHQPMFSSDDNIAIVFNGEIYNFQPLREELKRKGFSFKGGSDTEVILALYQAYGLECFAKMNGMFAIGLYDKTHDRLVLVRDRLGKKPLYWARFDNTIVFGSELKTVLAHHLAKKEIDPLSLHKYLAYDYVPTPHTIFKNIFKLEPGHYLTFENGAVEKKQFWDIHFASGRASENFDEVLKEMDRRLAAAVQTRLVSDVPLGIFLSGGLDSSTIAYYAQKESKEKIKTFSIGFAEKGFDESRYAQQVASYLGTDHHEHILSANESLMLIPEIGSYLDEPVADYSFIPTFLLSRFTRQHVTVALGGDGGDELFFGYPTFQAERLIALLKIGKPILHILRALAPVSQGHFNFGFKLERILAGLDAPERYRHHAWMGTFTEEERWKLLLLDQQTGNVYADIDAYVERGNLEKENQWNQLVYLYLRTYLMDQVLVKVDRASMANSLEVRAPFLDYEFVDFVNSVGVNFKINGLQTKYLLKELMKDKLPRDIVYRKKQGFGVPLSAWFSGELKSFVTGMLSEAAIRKSGLFDPTVVTKLVGDHMNHRRDNRKQLWSLLTLQMWFEKWMN